MNPLPVHGTKLLGGAITLGAVIDFLTTLTTTDSGAVTSLAGKYGPPILAIAAGILVILRGFQNSANATAQNAAPDPNQRPAANIAAVPTTAQKKAQADAMIPPGAKMIGFALLLLPLLLACATTNSAGTTQTFNSLILAAGTVDDTAINTIDSLLKAKALTSAEATSALAVIDKIQAGVNLANTTYAAGDETGAASKLAAASAAILSVQQCLTQTSTALVTCLQGVKTP